MLRFSLGSAKQSTLVSPLIRNIKSLKAPLTPPYRTIPRILAINGKRKYLEVPVPYDVNQSKVTKSRSVLRDKAIFKYTE